MSSRFRYTGWPSAADSRSDRSVGVRRTIERSRFAAAAIASVPTSPDGVGRAWGVGVGAGGGAASDGVGRAWGEGEGERSAAGLATLGACCSWRGAVPSVGVLDMVVILPPKAGTTARLRKVLEQYGLPTDVDASAEDLIPYISNDKKMRGNHMTLIILKEIGKGRLLPLAAEDLPKYIRKKDA